VIVTLSGQVPTAASSSSLLGPMDSSRPDSAWFRGCPPNNRPSSRSRWLGRTPPPGTVSLSSPSASPLPSWLPGRQPSPLYTAVPLRILTLPQNQPFHGKSHFIGKGRGICACAVARTYFNLCARPTRPPSADAQSPCLIWC